MEEHSNPIVGKKFGKLTVVSINEKRDSGRGLLIDCICDCGNLKTVRKSSLLQGNIQSCGCLHSELMKLRIKDLTGMRFGKWEVIKIGNKRNVGGGYKWICKCDCGLIKEIAGSTLVSGSSKSCISCSRKISGILPNSLSAKNLVFGGYKKHAEERNLSFNIEFYDFVALIEQGCFYCGIPASNKKVTNTYTYSYNGIDRVDNEKGYILDNCVPCCRDCNRAKLTLSKDEFLDLAKRIYLKHFK